MSSRNVLFAWAVACAVAPGCDDAASSGGPSNAGGSAGSVQASNAGAGGGSSGVGGNVNGPPRGGQAGQGNSTGVNGLAGAGSGNGGNDGGGASAGSDSGGASANGPPELGPDPCAATRGNADAGVPAAEAADASTPHIVQLVAGGAHHCALIHDGSVRCWGTSLSGELGYGNMEQVRDASGDEHIVNIGGPVRELAAGLSHTCALLVNGAVRCWGRGSEGQLGYGNPATIGDDELPSSAGDVDIGQPVQRIWAGGNNTCVLTASEGLRCWGDGGSGQLGNLNTVRIGDDETPAVLNDIDVGGPIREVAVAGGYNCALLASGAVRCWGYGAGGGLGYGNVNDIGDDEAPASAGDVDVGGVVQQIASAGHTCALLTTGRLRCWGNSFYGQLGYGNNVTIGDDETPASAGDVDVGATVVQLDVAPRHTCAILASGRVQCWGDRENGRLGYGVNVFYDAQTDLPSVAGPLDLCETSRQVATSQVSTCVLLDIGSVRCWGLLYESSAAAAHDIPVLFPPPD